MLNHNYTDKLPTCFVYCSRYIRTEYRTFIAHQITNNMILYGKEL